MGKTRFKPVIGKIGVQATAKSTATGKGQGKTRSAQKGTGRSVTRGTASLSVTGGGGGGFQTPNIFNNKTFTSGVEGLSTGGFVTMDGATRVTNFGHSDQFSLKRNLPVGGSGGECDAPFYAGSPLGAWTPSPAIPATSLDRVWVRWYWYLDADFDGTFKFCQCFDNTGYGTQFSGMYFENGFLSTFLTPEPTMGSLIIHLADLTPLLNQWNWCEYDYWRNGDPSGFPSIAYWLNGTQITSSLNGLPGLATWQGGRINFGQRSSSNQIGVVRWLGVHNSSPPTTIAANVWIDDLSISSLGRIGP